MPTIVNHTQREPGVLGRAFALLDALANRSDGAGPTWLAHRCGLPKATVHRLLQQLETLGMVQRHDGLYHIGPLLFRLGQAWQPYPRLLAAAHRPLHDLSATTNTSTVLTVRYDTHDIIAAANPARTEDIPLLRPGHTIPPDIQFITTPVQAPTGGTIGLIGAAIPNPPRRHLITDAVRHAARAINAALDR
jgi:IclR family acetate operon transcriptional repressor